MKALLRVMVLILCAVSFICIETGCGTKTESETGSKETDTAAMSSANRNPETGNESATERLQADSEITDKSEGRNETRDASTEKNTEDSDPDAYDRVFKETAEAGKYMVVFFFKDLDETTRAMQEVFASAVQKLEEKPGNVMIDISKASARSIVNKYRLDRAPMPLVLVVAPNGAVTGGFPMKFTEQQLRNAMVSSANAQCLKLLQEGKLVVLSVRNENMKSAQAVQKGIEDFRSDPRYSSMTGVVTVDPSDKEEKAFLKQLNIVSNPTDAITALLAPPGNLLTTLEGAVDKAGIVNALASCSSGCAPTG